MSEPTEPHPVPKAKLSAVSRFKQYAGNRLGIKSEPKIVFPPPSWFITDNLPTSSNEEASQPSAEPIEEPEPPEPTTFALKIRQLVESLPLPASVTAAIGVGHVDQGPGPDSTNTALPVDPKGPPIPDVVDEKTMRLLSSENVMNGDEPNIRTHPTDGPSGGVSYRQSVWSILERMKPGRANSAEMATVSPSFVNTEADTHSEKGVMMYSPLEPTVDSEVEIAESITEYSSEPSPVVDDGKGKAPETGFPPPPATMETHWVPSTTKISVLTTWWGYRLYLPPPVMATLDSEQMKATQRAAMMTAALTWFLKRVPTLMIPAPMMPTVKVLRRLAPLLGYIGVFIAWSWTRISACDKGNGVVLTATWLLPVALIPMAWDAGDIHGPRIRPPTPQGSSSNSGQPEAGASSSEKGKKSKRWMSPLESILRPWH